MLPYETVGQIGPSITPKYGQGGGNAKPSYLQTYVKMNQPQRPQVYKPAITPKSTVVPGEVKSPTAPAPASPPQAGGNSLGDLYNFMKSDLQNETNKKLADTKTDAAARGVYYGTPLTGSEADINTQYLRGLGQLQSGMFQNQQQDQLARLGLAAQLGWQNQMGAPQAPGPLDLSGIGALFANDPLAASRQGPAITPFNPQLPFGSPNKPSGPIVQPKPRT